MSRRVLAAAVGATALGTCPALAAPAPVPGDAGVGAPAGSALVRGGATALDLSCPSTATEACAGSLTIRVAPRTRGGRPGETVGRASFSVAVGTTVKVRVRISHSGLRLLSVRRRLRTVVRVVDTGTTGDTSGQSTVTTRSLTLRLSGARARKTMDRQGGGRG